jgi:hypothetical protein
MSLSSIFLRTAAKVKMFFLFLSRYRPVRIKFCSPRMMWRLHMRIGVKAQLARWI